MTKKQINYLDDHKRKTYRMFFRVTHITFDMVWYEFQLEYNSKSKYTNDVSGLRSILKLPVVSQHIL